MRNTDRADGIRQRHAALSPALDEQQLRRWAACEAKAFGYGGVSLVARISGLARSTIHAGLAELGEPPDDAARGNPKQWAVGSNDAGEL